MYVHTFGSVEIQCKPFSVNRLFLMNKSFKERGPDILKPAKALKKPLLNLAKENRLRSEWKNIFSKLLPTNYFEEDQSQYSVYIEIHTYQHDIDNGLKYIIDAMQEKYFPDDKFVTHLVARKIKVGELDIQKIIINKVERLAFKEESTLEQRVPTDDRGFAIYSGPMHIRYEINDERVQRLCLLGTKPHYRRKYYDTVLKKLVNPSDLISYPMEY